MIIYIILFIIYYVFCLGFINYAYHEDDPKEYVILDWIVTPIITPFIILYKLGKLFHQLID